ncbi:uncharacterized mitochondrial protein AtMg00860-like [Humulus lupulus]|uniref:uncharacterized mitochondrial protein AtMg00860-like n=1 Tax=Humulus lupulus TaxID=3486 RepID=UPI002B4053D3|nr:uncharacterized mitochondrial protein AtMg00860-like [Humulus lupulus]
MSKEEHVDHLVTVLQLLKEHGLYTNKKCSFGQTSVEYLGHIILHKGVAADKSKVQAMIDWTTPKTVKELKGFLGLTGYYRHFMQGYGRIAWPLTQLLKKDGFEWGVAADEAFKILKKAMVSVPVLALPDFTKVFVVESNAYGYALGCLDAREPSYCIF